MASSPVFGATYYLAPNGNNSNSCAAAQSASTAKASFSSAWTCLAAGDTLIVADGTYSSAAPPAGKSGAAGSNIVVRAATDGGARITGAMDFKGNAYIAFIGFKVTGSSHAISVTSNGTGKPSHDLVFQRIAFTCTSTSGNDDSCFSIADGTHHLLLEDSWGWGGGRYTVLCYGGPGGNPPNLTCDNNTFRRLVLRMGPSSSSSGNPQASLALYYASNNIVENVVALDGMAASDTSNAAFYLTAHAAPPNVSGNKFYGVLALNNKGIGWYLDHNGNGDRNELRNSVIWDSADWGAVLYGTSGGTCSGNILDHVTIGSSNNSGVGNYCSSTSVKSSILYKNSGYGLNGSSMSGNWNDLFGNTSGARSGGSAGSNDLTTDPALKYVGRIDAGSPCVSKGEGGSNCGADLTRRYQDGVMTSTALWPWPNQDRIRKDMCVDAGVSRGFCSAPSLTDYVWGYLGNANPYSDGTSTSLPQAPTNVRITQ